jgi:hypothetical protein
MGAYAVLPLILTYQPFFRIILTWSTDTTAHWPSTIDRNTPSRHNTASY